MKRNIAVLYRYCIVAALTLATTLTGAEIKAPTERIKVAIVQMAPRASLEENRDRIITGISEAAGSGARVAVFPAQNTYHPRRTSNMNPQMEAWYSTGATIIGPAVKPWER